MENEMTPRQKLMVLATSEWLRPVANNTAKADCDRIVKINWPHKHVAADEIHEQMSLFVRLMGSHFNGLNNLADFDYMVGQLSEDCAQCGVKIDYYESVCGVFLWFLRQSLGANYTPELRSAWIKLFGRIGYALSSRYSFPHKTAVHA